MQGLNKTVHLFLSRGDNQVSLHAYNKTFPSKVAEVLKAGLVVLAKKLIGNRLEVFSDVNLGHSF